MNFIFWPKIYSNYGMYIIILDITSPKMSIVNITQSPSILLAEMLTNKMKHYQLENSI